MKSKILWLRISYWIAALADFGIAIAVLIPEKMGLTEFVYPMGLMSATALSWGILLLVADRKPLERRWILIPTILVVVLLTTVRIYASANHLIDFSIGYIIFGIFITLLLSFSYYISRNLHEQK